MFSVNVFYSRVMGIIRIFLTLMGLLWFGALVVRATDRYVATNGTDSGTCESWATAASNIQYAINLAVALNDTVWVSNGSYRVTNQIMIAGKITVRSVHGWSNTLVYADWPAQTNLRCFYVSRTGTVDGFTISNGHLTYMDGPYAGGGSGGGGGAGALVTTNGILSNCYFVNNVYSNLSTNVYAGGAGAYVCGTSLIANCLFVSNVAYTITVPNSMGLGGAILLWEGQVLNCTMKSNYARSGGGVIALGNSDVISNCFISDNTTLYGSAGAQVNQASGRILTCVISNNTAGEYAGGISCNGIARDCTIINNRSIAGAYTIGGISIQNGGYMSNCVIAYNQAKLAGGVKIIGSGNYMDSCFISNNVCISGLGGGGMVIVDNARARNCLIHHNTNLSSSGGGVLMTNVATTDISKYGLINCTIANNWSTNEGGGIATAAEKNSVANCIIADNVSYSGNYPNVYHQDYVEANKSNYYYCCIVTTDANLFAAGQGNITNEPAFLGVSTWRLSANSPCINRGTNQTWMTNGYDLDGRTRIRYGTVDIGAYERIQDGTTYGFR